MPAENTSILDSLKNITIASVSFADIFSALILFLISYIIIRIITRAMGRTLEKSTLEKGVRRFISSIIKIGLWILAVIIIADDLGIKTTSLVAAFSVVGLALSLSMQDILSNIFSGMTILATKPFVSGNFITIGNVEGTVREVGIFYTTVLTVDNKCVYVPNKDMASEKIQNFSSLPTRRVDLTFPLPYDCEPERAKAALLAAAASDKRVLTDPSPLAAILSYKDGTAQYTLRAWVNSSDYLSVTYALNEAVAKYLSNHGISIAHSHLRVHIDSDSK